MNRKVFWLLGFLGWLFLSFGGAIQIEASGTVRPPIQKAPAIKISPPPSPITPESQRALEKELEALKAKLLEPEIENSLAEKADALKTEMLEGKEKAASIIGSKSAEAEKELEVLKAKLLESEIEKPLEIKADAIQDKALQVKENVQSAITESAVKVKEITPEKSLFIIPVPEEVKVVPSKKTPSKEADSVKSLLEEEVELGKSEEALGGEFAKLSRVELEERLRDEQYRTKLILQQLIEAREGAGASATSLEDGASVSVLDARIDEARARIGKIDPSVYDGLPGDAPIDVLQRADILFDLRQYSLALQQYYVVRDHPRRNREMDDSDQAWVRFQIGTCEFILNRYDSAKASWSEVNEYFSERGALPPEHIENKFRSFDEDQKGVLNWSSGFWRRLAVDEVNQFKTKLEFFQSREKISELTKNLHGVIGTFK